jgi:hypothetical protein
MNIGIDFAEDILSHLKHLHTLHGQCDGLKTCHAARAINRLELEIAQAKRQEAEFVNTAAPLKVDIHTQADAVIQASRHSDVRFMPATRLCVVCDAKLPSTTPATVNQCERCLE